MTRPRQSRARSDLPRAGRSWRRPLPTMRGDGGRFEVRAGRCEASSSTRQRPPGLVRCRTGDRSDRPLRARRSPAPRSSSPSRATPARSRRAAPGSQSETVESNVFPRLLPALPTEKPRSSIIPGRELSPALHRCRARLTRCAPAAHHCGHEQCATLLASGS